MGKGTKVVAHEGTGTGTGIFYKRGYGDGYYSTLPIGYPLPSLPTLSHVAFMCGGLRGVCHLCVSMYKHSFNISTYVRF
jgi:hypothetical protein